MAIFLLILAIALLISLVLVILAAALAVRSSGWGKLAAWINLALLAVPWLVAGAGGMLLSACGLAWRSCVKLPCGLAFVAGVLILFIRGGVFLVCWAEKRGTVAGTLGVCVVSLVGVPLCVAAAWYGLLFSAIWAGSDREVNVDGQVLVAEQVWMDRVYYAYHGPIVRGTEMLEGSGYLKMQAQREEKYRQDAAARGTAAKALGLDIPSGVVDACTDTHGGFHNDGTTWIKICFSDTRLLWDQVRDHPDWHPLPGPEELSVLADLASGGGDGSLFPDLSSMGDMDRYFFRDRFHGAEDVSDTGAALERGAYNFTLAVYDSSEQTLYFCKLDT